MDVEIRLDWMGGEVTATAAHPALEDVELVVTEYGSAYEGDPDDEPPENETFEQCRTVVAKMIRALAYLGLEGPVHFFADYGAGVFDGSGSSAGEDVAEQMRRAMAEVPSPVKITPEVVAWAREGVAEQGRRFSEGMDVLMLAMKQEGLRRGFDKERRSEVAIGDLLDRKDAEEQGDA